MLAHWRQAAIGFGALCGLYAFYAYGARFERRVILRLPLRGEPRWGVAWPLVDTWRALTKRTRLAATSHHLVCGIAPFVACILAIMGLAFIPRGTDPHDLLRLGDLWIPWSSVGLAWVCLLMLGTLVGTSLFGWASGQRLIVRQGVRALVWGISYQIPVWLAVAGVVLLTGSLDMRRIVEAQAQALPYLVYQPLAVLALGLSVCAGGRRLPIMIGSDHPDGLGDYQLQHAGWMFGLFHVGEYMLLILSSALISTLYLGGWWAPWYPGFHWLALKTVVTAALLLWVRHQWIGGDGQSVGSLAWQPLALVAIGNLVLTAALVAWRGG